jgi:hypothetical protein
MKRLSFKEKVRFLTADSVDLVFQEIIFLVFKAQFMRAIRADCHLAEEFEQALIWL